MNPRLRKLVGLILILAFMVLYIGAAAWFGERLPRHWLAQLLYYVVVGTAWGVPLVPLVRWMQRPPKRS